MGGRGQPRGEKRKWVFYGGWHHACNYARLPTACQASPKPAPDTQPVRATGYLTHDSDSPISIPASRSVARRQGPRCAPVQWKQVHCCTI